MAIVNKRLHLALTAFAEIKAAVDGFERGDDNLFDALDRIRAALSLTTTDECRRDAA